MDIRILYFGIVGGWFVIGVIATILLAHGERKMWNKGRCPNCNTHWELWDVDSGGGKLYGCPLCQNYFWASWISLEMEDENGLCR